MNCQLWWSLSKWVRSPIIPAASLSIISCHFAGSRYCISEMKLFDVRSCFLHISYICLADCGQHRMLQRLIGEYFPYLTQSVRMCDIVQGANLSIQMRSLIEEFLGPHLHFDLLPRIFTGKCSSSLQKESGRFTGTAVAEINFDLNSCQT